MATSLREWLAQHPPPDGAFRQSLAGVAERVRAGEDLSFAVREFLDEFALLPRDHLRRAAIGPRPLFTGDARADAYLGALAEHLAASAGLERPGWSVEDGRFLDRFWFPSPVCWRGSRLRGAGRRCHEPHALSGRNQPLHRTHLGAAWLAHSAVLGSPTRGDPPWTRDAVPDGRPGSSRPSW